MRNMGATPSSQQLQRLMDMMDSDRSGTIEWEEFLAAMTTWLADDSGSADGRSEADMV